MKIYWHFLNLLPQNLISRAAGVVARWELPVPFMGWVIRAFARNFKINVDEVALPIAQFSSLQSFFVRKLKEGARSIDLGKDVLVSPCDGAYGQSGTVENGLLLQVKGRTFRLSELLCDDKWSQSFEGGSYAVLYLSPRDYHRFHAPCEMNVLEAAHVPGRLWPVNLWAVRNVEELFCVNERVVMRVASAGQNSDPFAIIAVGATMVGKVKLEFDEELTTNIRDGRYFKQSYIGPRSRFEQGQELGRFEFGSTIVVVVPKKIGSVDSNAPGTPIKMGQKIGILNHATRSQSDANQEP